MDILSVILIAIGLAMDCFAVSVTQGTAYPNQRKMSVLMAFLFGLFQGAMPLIGFFVGGLFSDWVCRYDHWIALVLLSYIGGKMIYDSRKPEEEKSLGFAWSTLLLLAVATSIDALATGVLFVPCPEILRYAILIIALASFLLSMLGYYLGRLIGKRMKFNAEICGGVILILLGVKIFLEHTLNL